MLLIVVTLCALCDDLLALAFFSQMLHLDYVPSDPTILDPPILILRLLMWRMLLVERVLMMLMTALQLLNT